jgi:predicted Zn-dependent protease
MNTSRLDALRDMVRRSPQNPAARFGLANELMKAELWEEAATHLREYLASHEDEGNGWGRLAEVLVRLGDVPGAREALDAGIQAANRFGHPGMAADFEIRLEEMDDE